MAIESTVNRCSIKQLFWKISRNSQAYNLQFYYPARTFCFVKVDEISVKVDETLKFLIYNFGKTVLLIYLGQLILFTD